MRQPEKRPAEKRLMEADCVRPWAEVLQRRLAPACEKVVIAGSLRRQKPTVGDIEIVLLPRFDDTLDTRLFGDGQTGERWEYTALTDLLERYVQDGMLAWDTEVKRNGPRYKRLRAVALDGLPVDIFIADRHNFGNTLAIRTGCAAFSKSLVTSRQYGGLMPRGKRHENGYLVQEIGGQSGCVSCATEAKFFGELRLPVVSPVERDADAAGRLLKELGLKAKAGRIGGAA